MTETKSALQKAEDALLSAKESGNEKKIKAASLKAREERQKARLAEGRPAGTNTNPDKVPGEDS